MTAWISYILTQNFDFIILRTVKRLLLVGSRSQRNWGDPRIIEYGAISVSIWMQILRHKELKTYLVFCTVLKLLTDRTETTTFCAFSPKDGGKQISELKQTTTRNRWAKRLRKLCVRQQTNANRRSSRTFPRYILHYEPKNWLFKPTQLFILDYIWIYRLKGTILFLRYAAMNRGIWPKSLYHHYSPQVRAIL